MMFVADLCRDMANSKALTFSELGNAAARGAIAGQKVGNPLAGAMLGMSMVALNRAEEIAEDLIDKFEFERRVIAERQRRSPRARK